MEIISKSLMKLFFAEKHEVLDAIPPLHVLAHSAAGGHLTRFVSSLLDKDIVKEHDVFAQRIRKLCFSDSTHNIQWTQSRNCQILFSLIACMSSSAYHPAHHRHSAKAVVCRIEQEFDANQPLPPGAMEPTKGTLTAKMMRVKQNRRSADAQLR